MYIVHCTYKFMTYIFCFYYIQRVFAQCKIKDDHLSNSSQNQRLNLEISLIIKSISILKMQNEYYTQRKDVMYKTIYTEFVPKYRKSLFENAENFEFANEKSYCTICGVRKSALSWRCSRAHNQILRHSNIAFTLVLSRHKINLNNEHTILL